MPTWRTSSWVRRNFRIVSTKSSSESRKWQEGVWDSVEWTVDPDSVAEALNEMTDWCDENQYTVKAIVPLTWAKAYDYAQAVVNTWTDQLDSPTSAVRDSIRSGYAYGIGQGWGVGMVVGFAALVEMTEEVTEEEFAKRKEEALLKRNQRDANKQKAAEIARLSELQNAAFELASAHTAEAEQAQIIANAQVTVKRGLMGVKYSVHDQEFKTEAEAQAHVALHDQLRNKALAEAQAALDEVKRHKQAIAELSGQ